MCTWKKVDFLVALNNIHVVNESVYFYNYMEIEILAIFCTSQALQNVFWIIYRVVTKQWKPSNFSRNCISIYQNKWSVTCSITYFILFGIFFWKKNLWPLGTEILMIFVWPKHYIVFRIISKVLTKLRKPINFF